MHLKTKWNVYPTLVIILDEIDLSFSSSKSFLRPPPCCFVFESTSPATAFILPVVEKCFWSVSLSSFKALWIALDT